MPYSIRKVKNKKCYSVKSPTRLHAKCTSLKKAKKQVNLLKMIDKKKSQTGGTSKKRTSKKRTSKKRRSTSKKRSSKKRRSFKNGSLKIGPYNIRKVKCYSSPKQSFRSARYSVKSKNRTYSKCTSLSKAKKQAGLLLGKLIKFRKYGSRKYGSKKSRKYYSQNGKGFVDLAKSVLGSSAVKELGKSLLKESQTIGKDLTQQSIDKVVSKLENKTGLKIDTRELKNLIK